jgi:deoxyribodipyrimidine photo-lyase
MVALALFTRDLRITDNPVLAAADPDVVPLFVLDEVAMQRHGAPNRRAFLVESLADLDRSLRSLGSRLVVRSGDLPSVAAQVAAEAGADAIHIARDVSAFAQRRLRRLIEASPVPVVTHDSITVVAPNALSPASGPFYQVFTPFHRSWEREPRRHRADTPIRLAAPTLESDPMPETDSGGSPDRLIGGESRAIERLDAWLPRVAAYDETRNALAVDGTSMLSADLHFGTLSPLDVVDAATDVGADAFVRQLAWRDFNAQVLFHRPEASWSDYRGDGVAWNDDDEGFEAWSQGMTGFPVVDAGMRQLRATGWMHNRARMITASFLTKDLMIDWRRGAGFFLSWLTDGDIANNQLGWQWVAGTGTDTNPTRIFNPTVQSERFDPDGRYIRQWIPELRGIDRSEIHDPSPLTRASTGYPLPIVDHREAIRRFKMARGFKV